MKRYEESRIQICCKRWWNIQYKNQRKLFHSIPNGGFRNPREAAILVDEGEEAGAADTELHIARHGYHGLFVEFKTPTGRQSAAQKEFQRQVEAEGYKYIIVRSVEQFISEIKAYLN